MKKFGTKLFVGNKRVIKLRYTDMELSSRVVRFLHSQGYKIEADYTVVEYNGKKGVKTSIIEAIIHRDHFSQIMALKQYRIAEIALAKAKQLELW